MTTYYTVYTEHEQRLYDAAYAARHARRLTDELSYEFAQAGYAFFGAQTDFRHAEQQDRYNRIVNRAREQAARDLEDGGFIERVPGGRGYGPYWKVLKEWE